MAPKPSSAGTGREAPVRRTLGWSIAVVLAAGVVGAFTTPSAPASTVVQQAAGTPTPAGAEPPAAAAGPTTGASPAQLAAGTAAPAPTASTAAAAATASTKAPGASRATSSSRTATPATAAAPVAKAAASAQRLQPDAGTYALTITGTSAVDGKPSAVPATGSLVITGSGSDQQQRMVGVPGGLVLAQRATPAGADLVSLSLTAGSKTLTFRPPSPVAFLRTDPGASWTWSARSTDNTVGVSQTASVSAGGTVSVGGATVPAVTIQRVFTVSGAVQGTVRLTSTVSLVDRLPLVQRQVIDVKATVLLLSTRIVSDTVATLTTTRPR